MDPRGREGASLYNASVFFFSSFSVSKRKGGRGADHLGNDMSLQISLSCTLSQEGRNTDGGGGSSLIFLNRTHFCHDVLPVCIPSYSPGRSVAGRKKVFALRPVCRIKQVLCAPPPPHPVYPIWRSICTY